MHIKFLNIELTVPDIFDKFPGPYTGFFQEAVRLCDLTPLRNK